jgi:glycosyltransferase involved in cell wall biosynthesis
MWWLWQFHRKRLQLVLDTDDWEGWGGWNDREAYTAVQKHFFAWQEKWGMNHCHILTVASRALQTIALSQGVPQAQVLYLPNGPGISEQYSVFGDQYSVSGEDPPITSSPHQPTILVYSRLFEFEVERLVAILREVKTAVSDLHILFVGAGLFAGDAAQLRQQLQEADLLACATDAGWVETEKLPEILTQADVGIYLMEDTLLNRTKCPVKLADMQVLGIPLVAEAVGQVSEYVIHGRNGLLRPTGDHDGLIQDLIFLLQNPDQRQQMARAARQHIARHFNWQTLARQLEAAYQARCDTA